MENKLRKMGKDEIVEYLKELKFVEFVESKKDNVRIENYVALGLAKVLIERVVNERDIEKVYKEFVEESEELEMYF
ncbi:MAG: hypothetical protein KBE03_03725 [Leptotrichiaceae bacterium]|nr:hypothetical protein [Leptotrichiaceae bacterium]